MDSDAGGFVKGESDTPGKKAGGDSKGSSKALLPIHSNILLKLTHSSLGLVCHRFRFTNVTMVGFVSEVVDTNNKTEFRLADSFGPSVLVQMWKAAESDSGSQPAQVPDLTTDSLVRVYGIPRKTAHHPDPLILASKIDLVTDVNELMMHYAEVVHALVSLRKRKENHAAGLPETTGFPNTKTKQEGNGSMFDTSLNTSTSAANTSRSAAKPVPQQAPKDLVLAAIAKDTSAMGISLVELEKGLKSLNLKTIKEALDFLQQEGHIYTTTDDHHFKSLEA